MQNEKGKWTEGHKGQLVTALLLLYMLKCLSGIWTRGGGHALGISSFWTAPSLAFRTDFFLIEKPFVKNGTLLAKFSLNGLVSCRFWYADRNSVAANS